MPSSQELGPSVMAGGVQIGENSHVRLTKLILNCVICLGVSIQGFASVSAADIPCPMAQTASESTLDSGMHAGMSHDCCTDAASFAKTGKLCKMGLSCQPVSQAPMIAASLAPFCSTTDATVALTDRVIAPRDPSPVWRPPALI